MKKLIGNDLVINEDSCNLSCEYCLTGQSNLKQSHRDQLIFQPPVFDEYKKGHPLGDRINTIISRIDQLGTPFIKLTGGEIFLIKNMMDLIEEVAETHEMVVIQTNGLLIRDKHIERLKKLKNIVIQISLDSHLHYGNSYRISKSDLHKKAVEKIKYVLESKIPSEIYAVLNDRSVTEIIPFVEWLQSLGIELVYFPFPVRGPSSEQFKVRPDQIKFVTELYNSHEKYASILPPKPYFLRLLRFYLEGERRFRCHLPRLVISSFSDGTVTPCPNIWFSDMGSALSHEEEWADVKDKVGKTGLYQSLLAEKPRLKACKGCLTPWDTLSMYFEDEITLEELCAAPTYSSPSLKKLLKELKDNYLLEEKAKKVAA